MILQRSLLTPDDVTIKREAEGPAARDNVLFELGLFIGALGRGRTFIVRSPMDMQMPSDLGGVIVGWVEDRKDGNLDAAVTGVAHKIKSAIRKAPPLPAGALTQRERSALEAEIGPNGKIAGAKRILTVELQQARKVLTEEILDPGKWPVGRNTRWQETWTTYRADLVDVLGDDYEALSTVFDFVSRLQDGLRTGPREFIPTDLPFLHEALKAINRGQELLAG